jgi:hypothetical protein
MNINNNFNNINKVNINNFFFKNNNNKVFILNLRIFKYYILY